MRGAHLPRRGERARAHQVDTKGGVEITQYEGHTVADMGLLKMDFLGLRTLTVISKAKANIKKNFGIDIDVDAIPFDDPKIFELMCAGRTAGVFQVESAGMTATIKNMKPTEYKHVVALSPCTARASGRGHGRRATSTA